VYRIEIKKKAQKQLRKAPAHVREKAMRELDCISTNPHGFKGDWKPLTGTPYWRLRVGGYRAICRIEDDVLILLVLEFGSRGDIYK